MIKAIKPLSIALACAAIFLLAACVFAGFTWEGGSSSPDAIAMYGVQGVAAATNNPGARDGGATWTDDHGDMWLFGGFAGYQNNPTGNFLNDLWKYSPVTRQWTWVSGPTGNNTAGMYGTLGVAAAGNSPGARSNVISWKDANGDFWLFGGGGADATDTFLEFNDLWKYSPKSGLWAWMGGSSQSNLSGVYGTQGVPASANTPGARVLHDTVWTDHAGNIWLFGGYGFDAAGNWGPQNDLWKLSPATGEWTWISGSETQGAIGVYGTQGFGAPTNTPGARYSPTTWTDRNGDLWLFGGYGVNAMGFFGVFNDLWKFSPSTGEWTWVKGPADRDSVGNYGSQGVAADKNLPAGRSNGAGWTDAEGNLWLFAGEGLNMSTGFFHRLNDVWKYSPSTNQWTWVTGSSTFDSPGIYGTQFVPAATNVPAARTQAFKWIDAVGNVYLFGGYQYDDPTNTRLEYNDLWLVPAV